MRLSGPFAVDGDDSESVQAVNENDVNVE